MKTMFTGDVGWPRYRPLKPAGRAWASFYAAQLASFALQTLRLATPSVLPIYRLCGSSSARLSLPEPRFASRPGPNAADLGEAFALKVGAGGGPH